MIDFYDDCCSSQLWIILSNVYGQLLVVLMIALCLAEVMDTPVPLLSLQVNSLSLFIQINRRIKIKSFI